MNSIEKLIEIFRKFPGIGPRQAKRFVYFLLSQNNNFLENLSSILLDLKNDVSQCESCYHFFKSRDGVTNCEICSDVNIDNKILMVVEKDVDLDNIQKTGSYRGKYFILGGNIPILERNPTSKIRAKELFIKVQNEIKNGLREVVLAVSVNPEGENTTQYLKKILEPLSDKYKIKITTLGRGLSTGTELEYSDADTLENAFRNRQ